MSSFSVCAVRSQSRFYGTAIIKCIKMKTGYPEDFMPTNLKIERMASVSSNDNRVSVKDEWMNPTFEFYICNSPETVSLFHRVVETYSGKTTVVQDIFYDNDRLQVEKMKIHNKRSRPTARIKVITYRSYNSWSVEKKFIWILRNSINLSLHLSKQSATESVLQFYLRSNLPIKVCSLY
ncbi:uncharacterized protein LOC111046212 isoform X2 [Nilaparvata lugens]|uniref:uncharacterized protein LOC111046212 isoform X2 n=1 Tax=Nilaparvata lugens TaxID=108931 RepID=UPI00193DAA0B|nr:uncharacterized protein LOC111046212 isoform X2 [Nilaparvata lugens]